MNVFFRAAVSQWPRRQLLTPALLGARLHSPRPLSAQSHDEFTERAEERTKSQHETEKQDVEDEMLKDKILLASLKHVPEQGWQRQAIINGVQDLGYPSVSSGIIENEAIELILFHMRASNEKLEQTMAADTQARTDRGEKLAVNKFLREQVETRLRMNIPYKAHWSEALAIKLAPANLPGALQLDLELFDAMWFYAGDKNTDLSWYAKRLSLGAIYKTTELAMVQDTSEDFKDTWTFLDRRFSDELEVAKVFSCSQDVRHVAHGIGLTVQNMLGLQRH